MWSDVRTEGESSGPSVSQQLNCKGDYTNVQKARSVPVSSEEMSIRTRWGRVCTGRKRGKIIYRNPKFRLNFSTGTKERKEILRVS